MVHCLLISYALTTFRSQPANETRLQRGERKMDMIQLAIGALALSVNHALMPDHWIPLVMISRAEG